MHPPWRSGEKACHRDQPDRNHQPQDFPERHQHLFSLTAACLRTMPPSHSGIALHRASFVGWTPRNTSSPDIGSATSFCDVYPMSWPAEIGQAGEQPIASWRLRPILTGTTRQRGVASPHGRQHEISISGRMGNASQALRQDLCQKLKLDALQTRPCGTPAEGEDLM
jgi:hypothetical protein